MATMAMEKTEPVTVRMEVAIALNSVLALGVPLGTTAPRIEMPSIWVLRSRARRAIARRRAARTMTVGMNQKLLRSESQSLLKLDIFDAWLGLVPLSVVPVAAALTFC